MNDCCCMVWVKIFIFWPCLKWKLAIFCRNGKWVFQIFNMLWSMWKSTRKDIKSWKKVSGRSTHFCLGPKSKIACHGTVLALRSQVLFPGTSTWWVLLIMQTNMYCPKKVAFHIAISTLRSFFFFFTLSCHSRVQIPAE